MEDPTPSGNKKFRGANGDMLRKTEMCKNFQEGRCGWGDKCNYAHSVEELKAATTDAVSSSSFTQVS